MNYIKFILIVAFVVTQLPHPSCAQYGNVWVFGANAGIDFNQNPPQPIKTAISVGEGSASICGADGRLLFYTDGNSVWDRNNDLMPSGSNLPGQDRNVIASSAQGALIIPIPGKETLYYLFSLEQSGMSAMRSKGRLFYSVIDLSLNNGLGDVVLGSKGKLLSVNNTEQMTAVLGENCNIWLITAADTPSQFRVYKVDDHGLDTLPIISNRIPGTNEFKGCIGMMDVSPDRTKLAITQGNLVLYHFDATTGKVSHPIPFLNKSPNSDYGVAFSPNNSKLYVSSSTLGDSVRQFDLSLEGSAKIVQSRTIVSPVLTSIMAIKRAPDGKVYCIYYGGNSLDIIHQPDLASPACQAEKRGLKLARATTGTLGLPNSTTIVSGKRVLEARMDTAFCVGSYQVKALDTSGMDYVWEDGSRGFSRIVNKSGMFWVKYEVNAFCSGLTDIHVDTFNIVFDTPMPISILNNDTVVCKGAAVSINLHARPGYNLIWKPTIGVSDSTVADPTISINEPNTYTVTASFPGCPDTTATIIIGMDRYPEVELGPDKIECAGKSVALVSNVQPYRNDYIYQWHLQNQYQEFSNTPNIAIIADSSVTFALTVQTPRGCRGEDSIRLSVIPSNFGSIIADTGYCLPGSVQLWAKGGTSYQWSPSYGLDDSILAMPTASPLTPTTYTVWIEEEHGCQDSLNVNIDVWSRAMLTMADSVTIYPGEVYHLQPGTNCYYFQWFPSSGISSTTSSDPLFRPAVRTRYFVTATTEHGCSLQDSIDILVHCAVIAMPNAFKPTSGSDNSYKAAVQGIAKLKHFAIFNRWGKKIFETNDITKGWDGTCKGAAQPLGVYVYTIEAITECGQDYYKEGSVTLLW